MMDEKGLFQERAPDFEHLPKAFRVLASFALNQKTKEEAGCLES